MMLFKLASDAGSLFFKGRSWPAKDRLVEIAIDGMEDVQELARFGIFPQPVDVVGAPPEDSSKAPEAEPAGGASDAAPEGASGAAAEGVAPEEPVAAPAQPAPARRGRPPKTRGE